MMAHPTINILESPDDDCMNSAYNCVKYCFESTDYQTATGTKAQFTIGLNIALDGYSAGIDFTVAGQPFTTGTVNTYNEIDTAPVQTQIQFAQNVLTALSSNQYIYQNFELSLISGDTVVQAIARDVGIVENFVFDYSNFVTPPDNTDTQGTDDEYRENYRLIVEIWEQVNGATPTVRKISQEAYIPEKNGEFCLNIGEKVACYLSSSFLLKDEQAITNLSDLNIVKNFFLRYGESYSDTLSECDVELRHFESTEIVSVMNSAFERDQASEKVLYVCDRQFMTNAPNYTELCETSRAMLWIDLYNVVLENPVSPTIEWRTEYTIFYTDGTQTDFDSDLIAFDINQARQVKAIKAHPEIILSLADPLKTVDYYEVSIKVFDPSFPTVPGINPLFFGSHFFKLISCCSTDVEFYFLNQFGAFDTILFSELDSIDFQQDYSLFEQFLDCDDESINGGKKMIDVNSRDVQNVTSKFPNTYQSRLWLREFLNSPEKLVKLTIEGDEICSRVIILDASVKYLSNNDNSLLLRLSYILNEDLNTQKN